MPSHHPPQESLLPLPRGTPLTHHEHDQEKVTDLLQLRWAQGQQQPSQQLQPAHRHLVAHGIWLVAEHLQREHLGELLKQGFLGVAGKACQPLAKDPLPSHRTGHLVPTSTTPTLAQVQG